MWSWRISNAVIAAIEQSFDQIFARYDDVARSFYEHLFTLDPGLRPTLREDLRDQRRKWKCMACATRPRLCLCFSGLVLYMCSVVFSFAEALGPDDRL